MNLIDQGPTTLPARLPIKEEDEIVAGWHTAASTPTVSICCATYNHEAYIEDAICGFLAQETNFPFEIIIRDDCSNDGTTLIVKEYASRFPRIIRIIINNENEYQKGICASHVWPNLVRGKYIALCEGDDFWTTPHKLQKQIDLLERHPEAVMSVALTQFFQKEGEYFKYVNTTLPSAGTLIESAELESLYFHTSTFVIKSHLFCEILNKHFRGHTLFGDVALRVLLITHGPFVLLREVVSTYRMTGQGVWSAIDHRARLSWGFRATRKLATILNGDHRATQRRNLYKLSRSLFLANLRSRSLINSLKWGGVMAFYSLEEASRKLHRLARSLWHH